MLGCGANSAWLGERGQVHTKLQRLSFGLNCWWLWSTDGVSRPGWIVEACPRVTGLAGGKEKGRKKRFRCPPGLEDAVLFLVLCIFLFLQPLFHYTFMFLTLCTSFFFYYPFLSFTLGLPEYIQFQIQPEAVSKTRFSCSYHLASLLYLSYKYQLYNCQSIISKHTD